MSTSTAFEWVAARLESHSGFTRIEARGTLRLLLKDAGLDAATVTRAELRVVLEKLLPRALRQRGVADAEARSAALAAELARAPITEGGAANPEDVFRRIGRR